MHKMNPLGVAVLVSLAGLVLVVGCSDSEVRGANLALADKVADAQRLLTQAQNLIEAPLVVETGTGKAVPLPDVEVDPEAYQSELDSAATTTPEPPVRMVLEPKLNPRVMGLLDKAEKTIDQALENTQADDAHQAIARSVLGRIYEQKADALSRGAQARSSAAYARVGQARSLLRTLQQQQGILAYYGKILGLDDSDVEEMRSKAQTRAGQLRNEIDTLQSKVEALQSQQNDLLEKKNRLEAKARALRSEARAPGKKGIEADIQALEIMDQVSEIDRTISRLDHEAGGLQMELARKKMNLETNEALIAAGKSILTGREEGMDPNGMGGRAAVRRQQSELKREHQNTLVEGKQLLSDLTETLREWSQAEKDADNAYYAASTNYGQYAKLAANTEQQDLRADAMAQEAAVLMNFGRANIEKMHLHSEVRELLERLGEVWPGNSPSEVRGLQALLTPAIGQIRKTGNDNYREAIDLLDRAIMLADRNVEWLYQGAKARAYVGKAQLSGETSDLDKAQSALNDALEGQSDSPLVAANVGRIRYDIIEVRSRLGG